VADERHDEVYIAWQCAQQLRSAYKASSPVEGRRIAEQLLASLQTCPIPEIKRLDKTFKQWRKAFLAYFDTGRANCRFHARAHTAAFGEVAAELAAAGRLGVVRPQTA
jgi:Transposase